MTKKQTAVCAVLSFIVGVTIGMLLTSKNGKVVVNGDNNVVKTGYKSYSGNHNGNNNSATSKTKKDKKDKK